MVTVIINIILGIAFLYIYKKHVDFKKRQMGKTFYIPQEEILDDLQAEFLGLLNAYRISKGLNEVIPEALCSTMATARIVRANKIMFSHATFEYYKRRLEENNFVEVGEIMAKEYDTVQSMFNNYIKSKNHRQYIEDPKIKYVGLGVIDHYSNYYSCIIFTF